VRRAFALVASLLVAGLLVAIAAGIAVASPSHATTPACGVERWSVKTLTDRGARSVSVRVKATTIRGLRRRHPPAHLGSSRIAPVETQTFRVQAALQKMKIEEDDDIHLVVSQPGSPKLTMIVEFPAYACTRGADKSARKKMRIARSRIVRACGTPSRSHFTDLSGKATITGVGFFDIIHGQTGVAPNGIELHPVLSFTQAKCRKATPAPAPTPTEPTPTPTEPALTPTAPAPPSGNCDPSYPTVCIPPPPPDLNCADVPYTNFKVLPPDPHHFDGDKDGVGCES
jgi:hypothetical protein